LVFRELGIEGLHGGNYLLSGTSSDCALVHDDLVASVSSGFLLTAPIDEAVVMTDDLLVQRPGLAVGFKPL
jgi:hypothetical protein